MYIARFTKVNNDFKIQSVKEHSINVANLCKTFGAKLNISNLLYLAGLLHDMGKYSNEFQNYISVELDKEKKGIEEKFSDVADKVDHGVYGAIYIYEKYRNRDDISCITSEVLALICCYHHGGLPDCINKNFEIPLIERFKKYSPLNVTEVFKKYNDDINVDINEIFDNACSEIESLFNKFNILENQVYFSIHLFIKTAYSMLIDADRYDSYLFEIGREIKNQIDDLENNLTWHNYLIKLEEKLDKFKYIQNISENEARINKIRQDISDECLDFANNDEGIYSLTVPTGGGKTLSSLRFALKHAELKNKDRIVYILPYTTIIEQNADEVRKSLQCNDDLLEYHSNVMEDDKGENYKLLTNRWSNKIIYTTMVQFLNSFYNKGTQDMRRIHNLLNSIIIFDEVQTIPIKCIELFNSCINYLNRIGNSTIVLCSATQPDLNKSKAPIFFSNNKEIIKDTDEKFKVLERVEVLDFTKKDGYSLEEAAMFLLELKKSDRSLLMVCNTVNSATKIHDLLFKDVIKNIDINILTKKSRKIEYFENGLKKEMEVYLLTSNLCPAHRKDIISEIKCGLKSKKDIICISTTLIEAGVDISFSTTVRALTGLDSIAQTSGRGNRHGENAKGYSYIINLNDDDELVRLTETRLGKTHSSSILDEYKEDSNNFDNSLLSPKSIKKYFGYYYSDNTINKNMDYPFANTSIYQMLSCSYLNIDGYEDDFPLQFMYKFKTAGEVFKVIDNDTKTVLVPYKEGENIISELLSNDSYEKKKMMLDKLGQYSVNIYNNKFETLKKENGLVFNEKYRVYILKNSFYDDFKGIGIKSNFEFLSF